MGRLDGKVALVTGSTRGLGRVIAGALAAEGAAVAVTGRTTDDGTRVAREILDAGGTAEYVPLDLAEEGSVQAAATSTVARFGKLNVLVNNAAPTEYILGSTGDLSTKLDGGVTEIDTDAWRKITTPSIDGLMWMLKYSIPHMQDAGGGSIINISSVVSVLGAGGLDAYTATKGAMNALTRSIAVGYAPLVRCNTLVAGGFVTEGLAPMLADPRFAQAFDEMVLTPEFGRPEHMAMTVVFFASDESAYITGQQLQVDGGMGLSMPFPKVAALEEADS
jgi:NAD(P)-dependent dehydrogenase (short-subunit alcohol dehydrogenase family)